MAMVSSGCGVSFKFGNVRGYVGEGFWSSGVDNMLAVVSKHVGRHLQAAFRISHERDCFLLSKSQFSKPCLNLMLWSLRHWSIVNNLPRLDVENNLYRAILTSTVLILHSGILSKCFKLFK